MFAGLAIMFFFVGIVLAFMTSFFPGVLIPIVALGMRFMGWVLCGVGLFLLIGRETSTGAIQITNVAKPNEVTLFHGRRGGKTFILKGMLVEMEHIVARFKGSLMLFKDTGASRNVANHDIRFTNEVVNATIPEKIAHYLWQIKKKFKIDEYKDLLKLVNDLRYVTSHEDLYKIKHMKKVLDDPETRKQIMAMPIEDVRKMSELMYDGEIMHYKDYADFQESAAPYDLESYTTKKIVHRVYQNRMYMALGGMTDYMKWVLAIIVLFIGGAIAYQIFIGG